MCRCIFFFASIHWNLQFFSHTHTMEINKNIKRQRVADLLNKYHVNQHIKKPERILLLLRIFARWQIFELKNWLLIIKQGDKKRYTQSECRMLAEKEWGCGDTVGAKVGDRWIEWERARESDRMRWHMKKNQMCLINTSTTPIKMLSTSWEVCN